MILCCPFPLKIQDVGDQGTSRRTLHYVWSFNAFSHCLFFVCLSMQRKLCSVSTICIPFFAQEDVLSVHVLMHYHNSNTTTTLPSPPPLSPPPQQNHQHSKTTTTTTKPPPPHQRQQQQQQQQNHQHYPHINTTTTLQHLLW